MMRHIRKKETLRTGWAMFVSADNAINVARWCRGTVGYEFPNDRAEEKVLTVTYGPEGAEKHVRLDEWLVHFAGEFFAVPAAELEKRFEFTSRQQ